jgi:phosphatidylglycerophosphatase A
VTARLPISVLREPVHLLALGFGAGLVPRAPGTAGSVLALGPAWLMMSWPLAWRVAAVSVALFVGIWIAGESARRLGRHDHPAIVVDEIVGLLAAALAIPGGLVWLCLVFVFFRIFDITKPWPIRDLDHSLPGGTGIMLDDLMAALYAAVCIRATYFLVSIL